MKFKTFNDPKPGSDDQSIPESFRIAQAVNGTDEIAQAEYFTFSMYDEVDGVDAFGNPETQFVRKNKDFFYHQCIGLGIKNQQLAERLFNTLPRIWNFRLTLIHIKLLQLVFKGDINFSLYPALNYDQLMAAICLAQVKLFEHGFEHLAQLCSIVRNPSYPQCSWMTILNCQPKTAICYPKCATSMLDNQRLAQKTFWLKRYPISWMNSVHLAGIQPLNPVYWEMRNSFH